MRRLHPFPSDHVDLGELYASPARAPQGDGRPWLLLNMVVSIDGATTVAGVSGSLGGAADREAFHAIRGIADVILVGAATVRAERYGPPRPDDATRAARVARGQAPAPRLAVVSARVDLDPASRLFADADRGNRPLVLTATGADPARLAAVEPVAEEVVVVGEGGAVDMAAAMAALGRRGARVVLCEGGPSINGQLIAAGVVDEVCLTIAAALVGGDSPRFAHGPDVLPLDLPLADVVEADGTLLLRYARASAGSASGA